MPIVSHPSTAHSCEEPGSVSLVLPHRYWATGSPQSHLFSGWTSLASSAFHYRASTPAPRHLGGPLLNSLQFINVFFKLEGPKLDTVFKMPSNKSWAEKDSHFPWTTAYAPGKSDPPHIRRQPSVLLFSAMRNCLWTLSNIKGTFRNGQIQSSVASLSTIDTGGLWIRL